MPVLEIEQDDVLDEEESEVLVPKSSSTRTTRSTEPSNTFTARSRWIVLVLLLTTALLFVIRSDSREIATDEEKLSEVQNVKREKNVSSTNVADDIVVSGETNEAQELRKPKHEQQKEEQQLNQKPTVEPSLETEDEIPDSSIQNDGSSSDGRGVSPREWRYNKRGPPLTEAEENELAKKWGKWNFVDPKADTRPTEDFMAAYPNRDIPRSDFPSNAWQVDTDYLRDFLKEATDLVERAMETILSEYGRGKFDSDDPFEERAAAFDLRFQDREDDWVMGKTAGDNGGWTTTRSFDGLVRRLLHAIMTEDTFTLVMGGHSAAAGHGNHFQQSYTLQFQRVMEPVFARLGVKHVSRNMGMGGLGTIQNALAAGSLYGPDMDILMWDSGMTEKNAAHLDIFARQGLIGGDRVPVLWNGNNNVLKMLHDEADADVFYIGTGRNILTKAETLDDLENIPWAARYMSCGNDIKELCKPNRYNGTCWIERSDLEPPTEQKSEPGGRASWHPGNREHQLSGRVMAFIVLKALHQGLTMWSGVDGFAIPDNAWHVTRYNENIRAKVLSLDSSLGYCYDTELSKLPTSVCKYPMKAASENTPRYNPEGTSIRAMVVPPGRTSEPREVVYEPPDVHNPILDAPKGAIEYLSIIENGLAFRPRRLVLPLRHSPPPPTVAADALDDASSRNRRGGATKLTIRRELFDHDDILVPGLGWYYQGKAGPHRCDGSYDSWCGKDPYSDCLLYNHNDGRFGLLFDSYSGWLKLKLKGMKYGLVLIKFESWHPSGNNPITADWTSENNAESRRLGVSHTMSKSKHLLSSSNEENFKGSGRRGQQCPDSSLDCASWVYGAPDEQDHRFLKKKPPAFCRDLELHFAIDGKITKWNKTEVEERRRIVQRVVEVLVLMDDPDFTGGEKIDVQVALKMQGCAHINNFLLSHIYWA